MRKDYYQQVEWLPGDSIKIASGEITGVVDAVQIHTNSVVRYSVVWWMGGKRSVEWFERYEVS